MVERVVKANYTVQATWIVVKKWLSLWKDRNKVHARHKIDSPYYFSFFSISRLNINWGQKIEALCRQFEGLFHFAQTKICLKTFWLLELTLMLFMPLHELLMSLVEVQKLLINHFPENFCTFRTYLLSLSKQLSSGLIKMISTHLEM